MFFLSTSKNEDTGVIDRDTGIDLLRRMNSTAGLDLSSAYVFTDVCHGMVTNWKTVAASVFSPEACKVLTIAVMFCKNETSETLTFFWSSVVKVAAKHDVVVDFYGCMQDAAGTSPFVVCFCRLYFLWCIA